MPSVSCTNPGPKLSLSPPAVTAGVVSGATVISGTDGPAAVVSGAAVVAGAAVVSGAAVVGTAVVAAVVSAVPSFFVPLVLELYVQSKW